MTTPAGSPNYVEIAETMLRLYVFLSQYLDRCVDQSKREAYPESELQAHLSATRERLRDILVVNPVVKGKVEKESERVLGLGVRCLKGGPERDGVVKDITNERAVLREKTVALSDLLAVYRAL